MDEDKKPTIWKLTERIWHRYQIGSPRRKIAPCDDLQASIDASLTNTFDYRAYLLELPKCRRACPEHLNVRAMSEEDLMEIPRDEAMSILACQIHAVLSRRINMARRAQALLDGVELDAIDLLGSAHDSAARRAGTWQAVTGGASHIPT